MRIDDIEHAWFEERIMAHLAGGLDEEEAVRFTAHAAECGECAAKLETSRKEEQVMQVIFAGNMPGADFEDSIIADLRHKWTPRLVIHPMVRRAAIGVAAVLVLGAMGYSTSMVLERGGLPTLVSSNGTNGGFAVGPFRFVTPRLFAEQVLPRIHMTSTVDTSGPQDEVSANQDRYEPGSRVEPLYKKVAGQLEHGDSFGIGAGVTRLGAARAPLPADGPTSIGAQSGRNIVLNEAKVTAGMRGVMPLSAIPQQYGVVRSTPPVDAPSFKPAEYAKVSGTVKVPDGGTLLLGGAVLDDLRAKNKESNDSVMLPWDQIQQSASKALKRRVDPEMNKAEKSDLGLGERAFGPQITVLNGQAANVTVTLNKTPVSDLAAKEPAPQPVPAPAQEAPDVAAGRKIIRNGNMEFEVDSFDSAFAQISKIAKEEQGFVASTESQKLANGKMTGTITLRVVPEHLDTLVLKLRALGDLKNQKIVAQDVTKQYTDLESQLRASRAMEQRLLDIIKTGKGEIKDLVAAEKELGVWREKIEQSEGEIRFYNSQISLSTLLITLSEKDVKAAAFASESELRSVGIEVEDVEKTYAAVQALVAELKGHVVTATLKKLEAGQFAANVVCDVAPDNAGPLSDRLKQLGNVARLEAERKITTADGALLTGTPTSSKVQRQDTRFVISLYNLANIAPRETTNLNLACRNVEQAYRAILLRVAKAGGRIVGSNLNQLKSDQTTATLSFQVKSDEADALLKELRKPADPSYAGDTEVIRLTTAENADTANVSAAKRGFVLQIVSLASVAPRETVSLQLAAGSVADAYKTLADLLNGDSVQARILCSQLAEQDRQNVTATLDFEVRRTDLPIIEKALAAAGDVYSRNATRAAEAENTIDSKVRLTMSLFAAQNLAPRETYSITIEAGNVEKAMGDITLAAAGLKGRTADSRLSRGSAGQTTGRLIVDVPLTKSTDILKTVREQGTIRTVETGRNAQVPEGTLARARLDIVITDSEGIVAGDKGIWTSLRNAMSTSVAGLLWSLQLIVIGLFLVVPWVLVIWGGMKLLRRMRRGSVVPSKSL